MSPVLLLRQREALAASEPWDRAGAVEKFKCISCLDRRGNVTHVAAN